jgi:hypothetical protein
MQIENDYISIHIVFLWKFLQNNEIVIRQQKKPFWRKQEIKNKTKNIRQMGKMQKK